MRSRLLLEERYLDLKKEMAELTEQLNHIKIDLIETYKENPEYESNLVNIYYIPSKRSISWKKVAEKFDPPEELIEQCSSYSKETYGFRERKIKDEQ